MRLETWQWAAAAAGTAAMLAGGVAVRLDRWAGRSRRSRIARRRGARAVRGERDAEALLEAHGYTIIERQATRVWSIETGDDVIEIELRADLLVERGGRSLVAEVKTGEAAPTLDNAATRRQLLEYRVAYPVDGAVLVDVEAGAVTEIGFPGLDRPAEVPAARGVRAGWVVAAMIVGAALGYLAHP